MLVGAGGSGTIFLAGCNLNCVFCQNYDISHTDSGRCCTPGQIADLCLELEQTGCENINFVTPTHVSPAVAETIVRARARGLSLPTVYNCGGYEAVQTLRLLEGLIDIYMPDFKYGDAAAGEKYSGVPDYPEIATGALGEMYRQAGRLELDAQGLVRRGVMVRHLVLPGGLAGSEKVIDLIAQNAPGCAVNIMAQYHPAYQAERYAELIGRPDGEKIIELRNYAAACGLVRLDADKN